MRRKPGASDIIKTNISRKNGWPTALDFVVIAEKDRD